VHHFARLTHIADGADFDAIFVGSRLSSVALKRIVVARRRRGRAYELLANLEAQRAAGDLFRVASRSATQHDEPGRRTERHIGDGRDQSDADDGAVVVIRPVKVDATRARAALAARVISLIGAARPGLARRLPGKGGKQ